MLFIWHQQKQVLVFYLKSPIEFCNGSRFTQLFMELIYLYIVAISLLWFFNPATMPTSLFNSCLQCDWNNVLSGLCQSNIYMSAFTCAHKRHVSGPYVPKRNSTKVSDWMTSLSYSLTIRQGCKKKNTKFVVGSSKTRALLTKLYFRGGESVSYLQIFLLWTWPWAQNLLLSIP